MVVRIGLVLGLVCYLLGYATIHTYIRICTLSFLLFSFLYVVYKKKHFEFVFVF